MPEIEDLKVPIYWRSEQCMQRNHDRKTINEFENKGNCVISNELWWTVSDLESDYLSAAITLQGYLDDTRFEFDGRYDRYVYMAND